MQKGTANFINFSSVKVMSYSESFDSTVVRPEILINDFSSLDYLKEKNHFSPISTFEIPSAKVSDLSIYE